MPIIRLLEPGFQNLTGVLHDIEFTNGVSGNITQADAERLATFGRVQVTNGNGDNLGPVIESSGEVANNFPPVRRTGGYKRSVNSITIAVAATAVASLRELVSGEDVNGIVVKALTGWTILDPTKATIVVANTGIVTVTGVAAGTTTLRLAANADHPEITIPVTVTA